MRVVVKAVNFRLTPSLIEYASSKLFRPVEKLLARSAAHEAAYQALALELELIYGSRHHKKGKIWEAVANLQLPGRHAWYRTFGEDMRSAIDALEDTLKREIKKYKERSRSRELRGARQAKKDLHFARQARLYRKGRIRSEGA